MIISADELRQRQSASLDYFYDHVNNDLIRAVESGEVYVDVNVPSQLRSKGDEVVKTLQKLGYDVQRIQGQNFREQWDFIRIEW